MALRQGRQKRFAKIQPLFNNKYGNNYDTDTWWYSYSDDSNNGIYINAPNVGRPVSTNFSIALPSDEVFHLQEESYYGASAQAYYVSDSPSNNVWGNSFGWTITCGVTLRFLTATSNLYTRDKPWLKYGITWECYGTIRQTEQTLTAYDYNYVPPRPIYSSPNTVATTPYYWYHQVEPTGLGDTRESNSLFIPAASTTLPPEGPNEGGGESEPNPYQLLPIGTKRNDFYGSISVGNINIYRRGNYHHG